MGKSDQVGGNIYLWEWGSCKFLKRLNHTCKKLRSITGHPNGQYLLHAGHTSCIYVLWLNDVLNFGNDAIPAAHKVWTGDHVEHINFKTGGSFLSNAHQKELIKPWVWMGEDSGLKARRHMKVRIEQYDAANEQIIPWFSSTTRNSMIIKNLRLCV